MPRPRIYQVDLKWTRPELLSILPADTQLDDDVTTRATTSFDTDDRALGRHGISVRVGPDGCSVQLPGEEFTTNATSPRTVPREVQAVLLAVRGGRRLTPTAKTDVLRHVTRILGPDDQVHAVITEEQTNAITFGHPEIVDLRREVTLTASDKTLRHALHEALIQSGAQSGRADGKPAEVFVAPTSPSSEAHAHERGERTLGRLVINYLDEQHDALMRADVALRRGHDAVHSARVAVRRFRSVLRVFADVVEPERAKALDAELQWYGRQLGAVRDPRVQRHRLGRSVSALDPELVLGPVAARIEASLLGEQLKARTALDRAMRGQRYLALLAHLDSWRDEPPWTKRADRRQSAAARYLERADRKLTQRLRAASPGDDDALHRARRSAKRVRYVAELSAPALGKPAKRSAARARRLQTNLGEFVDSVVSCEVLWRLGAGTAREPNENGFTFGLLYEAERERSDRMRARAIRSAVAGRR